MVQSRVEITICRREALDVSDGFRGLTGLKRRLGCGLKRRPVCLDRDRSPERRESARQIASLDGGKTSRRFQAIFIRRPRSGRRQNLEFRGGERWLPHCGKRVGEQLAKARIAFRPKRECSLK